MTAFHTYLRTLLELAEREARADRSATIEAQHVLLAMASQSETDVAQLLESLGLDPRALRAALASEFGHALAGAGVSRDASERQRAASDASRTPQLAPSVQHALERGLGELREAPRPAHVLLGVLQAEVGTVPRALALAGFDRTQLIERVRQTLAA